MRTLSMNRRAWCAVALFGALIAGVLLASRVENQPAALAQETLDDATQNKILRGLQISPVPLNLKKKNRHLIGLGSYLVNAQFACSECHTWPQFAPGGNPFLGEEEEINAEGYLAGGRPFGPIISNNITPDPISGLPAGMTFVEFDFVMRSGVDRDHSFPPTPSPDNDLMQVMPWPVFRNITDLDMRALYEYLKAIPSAP